MILFQRIKSNVVSSPYGEMDLSWNAGDGHLLRGWRAGTHLNDTMARPGRFMATHMLETHHDIVFNEETTGRLYRLSMRASSPEERAWLHSLHVHLHREIFSDPLPYPETVSV